MYDLKQWCVRVVWISCLVGQLKLRCSGAPWSSHATCTSAWQAAMQFRPPVCTLREDLQSWRSGCTFVPLCWVMLHPDGSLSYGWGNCLTRWPTPSSSSSSERTHVSLSCTVLFCVFTLCRPYVDDRRLRPTKACVAKKPKQRTMYVLFIS